MADTTSQIGTGVVGPGLPGTANTLTVTQIKKATISSNNVWNVLTTYTYSPMADSKELKNSLSKVANKSYTNYRENVTVDCIATGTTKAVALATFNQIPYPGDFVEIASTSGDDDIPGTVAGNTKWIVVTAEKTGAIDDYGTARFTLERFETDLDDVAAS